MSRNSRIKNIQNEILVSYSKDIFNDYNFVSSYSFNEMGKTAICKLKFIECLENLYHKPNYIKLMVKATFKQSDEIRVELIEKIGELKRIIRFRNENYSEKIKQKYYTEQKNRYPLSLFNLLTIWEQRFGMDYFLISIETGVDIEYNDDGSYKLSGIYDDDVNLFIDNPEIESSYRLLFGLDETFGDGLIFENEFLLKKIICERILIDYYVKNASVIENSEVEKLLKKHIR